MRIAHGPSPAPTKMWCVPGGQWTKSQAFSRRSSPSIRQMHSPERTRKSSWTASAWYLPLGWPGCSDVDADSELRERVVPALEVHPLPALLVPRPARVGRVEHEPTFGLDDGAVLGLRDLGLRDSHRAKEPLHVGVGLVVPATSRPSSSSVAVSAASSSAEAVLVLLVGRESRRSSASRYASSSSGSAARASSSPLSVTSTRYERPSSGFGVRRTRPRSTSRWMLSRSVVVAMPVGLGDRGRGHRRESADLREQAEEIGRDADVAKLPVDDRAGELEEPVDIEKEVAVGHSPSIVDGSAYTR